MVTGVELHVLDSHCCLWSDFTCTCQVHDVVYIDIAVIILCRVQIQQTAFSSSFMFSGVSVDSIVGEGM